MSNAAILDTKGKNREEIESIEVAEDARELEWSVPSFAADLFMGKLRTSALLPYPEQTEDDRKIGDAYMARVETYFKAHVDPDQIDLTGEIPDEVMKGYAKLGLFGMKIPKEYGGLGLSQVNYNRTLALISGYCGSSAALLSAHQSIGVPQPLRLFGNEEQKRRYLPRLAAGAVSAFALTEPEVGSDPARMTTTAVPTADGKFFVINGTKLWCTNGAIAELIVVMAQTPAVMKNGREKKQITAFIVERDTPGFEVVHRCRFMGLNGIQNALLKFTDMKVPKENIIWGEGKGLRLALITLNAGRLSLPAGCIGGVRQCLRASRIWGKERKQWGASIGVHEAGAAKIGSMTAHLFAMEAITWLAGTWVDRKSHDIRLEAAMAKIFCSEHTFKIIDNTLQLRGGRGYERATSLKARGETPFPAERALRDARINMIVEGTSEILRLFVAREALDKHLRVAGNVLNRKLSVSKRFGALLSAGAFYVLWYPTQWLAPLVAYWPRFSGLEKRQMQLARIVDIATDLFAISATVARAQARLGKSEYGNVEDVADLFCREARARVLENFRLIRSNSDVFRSRVSKQILAGEGAWLEKESIVV
jgi:alkylation response protein AidB-like acyl-CoA dehydrogenase